MKSQLIPPTGTEQRFEINETFFSVTNLKGQIIAGNEVFSRTSDYTSTELIGSPHNLIRHPDMPRCVFDLLWKETHQNRPFSGYVKNHSKNGNHYWVLALIEPTGDHVLSVRIKPSSKILHQVERIYETLLAIEEGAIANGQNTKHAIELSTSKLAEETSTLGFQSYADFSHYCLNQEINSRDQLISDQRLALFPQIVDTREHPTLSKTYDSALAAYNRLQAVFSDLGKFLSMSDEIKRESLAIQKIAIHFRHYSLNANIACNPLGHKGATIGTITKFLHSHSEEFSQNASILIEQINGTIKSVTKISSRLTSARIQLEMQISFIIELLNNKTDEQTNESIKILQRSFMSTLQQTIETFQELESWLAPLKRKKDELHRSIVSFNVAQITGVMECSRIPEATNLAAMFTDLRSRIELAKKEISSSDEIIKSLERLTQSTPPQIVQAISDLQSTTLPSQTPINAHKRKIGCATSTSTFAPR